MAEKKEAPEILQLIADDKGTALRTDLERALKVLGVVKGPFANATAKLDDATDTEGRVDLSKYWWEVLTTRYQVIIGSKIRMERPEGWSLRGAMNVAATFSDTGSDGSAPLSRSEVRAILEDFGVDDGMLDTCVEGLRDEASDLGAWQQSLSGDPLRCILEALEDIIDVPRSMWRMSKSANDEDAGDGAVPADTEAAAEPEPKPEPEPEPNPPKKRVVVVVEEPAESQMSLDDRLSSSTTVSIEEVGTVAVDDEGGCMSCFSRRKAKPVQSL